jgi:hypothetical protein
VSQWVISSRILLVIVSFITAALKHVETIARLIQLMVIPGR